VVVLTLGGFRPRAASRICLRSARNRIDGGLSLGLKNYGRFTGLIVPALNQISY